MRGAKAMKFLTFTGANLQFFKIGHGSLTKFEDISLNNYHAAECMYYTGV